MQGRANVAPLFSCRANHSPISRSANTAMVF
jgi:hypothetical protein